MNKYIEKVIDIVKSRDSGEKLFNQTVDEVLHSLEPVMDRHPEYEEMGLLERMIEPERIIQFRVTWVDDNGKVNVNRGWRVQWSSAIGPYKGGLRFAPNVTLDTMKFLAFEQTFKNSLTGLPIGGGKGGSDFNPKGKSDREIMRFCQAFMTELHRYIGRNVDVPAGDIGVGTKEIGYMFGQYKRIRGTYEPNVITGKALAYGGSFFRPEATGYGAVYYLCEVLKHERDSLEGKTVVISGYGNVSWGVIEKVTQLGGKVVTISGKDGYVYDENGINTNEKIKYVLEMRTKGINTLADYAEKFGCKFFPGEKPWGVKGDIYMPCACQNEVNVEDAKKIASSGARYYLEVSNMPTTNEGIEYFKTTNMIIAPSKAVNAGGVAVSGLEMSQNSQRLIWTPEEVDNKLHDIMINIHKASAEAAEKYGLGYDLFAGANIAGFKKVADAMMGEGLV